MASVELRRAVEVVLLVEKVVAVKGKGYSDLATRELAATLSDMRTPVLPG